jgi:hypothetical protein
MGGRVVAPFRLTNRIVCEDVYHDEYAEFNVVIQEVRCGR